MTYRMQYLKREWICNSTKAGGAQAELLSDLKDEPAVYIRVDTKNGRRYGVIPVDELVVFASSDRSAFEIVPTQRRRKCYLDFDHEAPNTHQPDEYHDRVFKDMIDKAVADVESVCGPGIAVLSGSWGVDGDNIKYSLHLVRPDRYFANHAAALAMPAIASSIGADPGVYSRNQSFKLPNQSKYGVQRVQRLITGELRQHVLTTAFEEDASELKLAVPHPRPMRVRTSKSTARQPAPLAPWHEPFDIPDNWAMTSEPLTTLGLIRHSPKPPHRLSRALRFVVMGWARHRGVAFEDYLKWAFEGKEDTHERRGRYSTDWRAWGDKRPLGDKHILLLLKVLYPDKCFDNRSVRVHRQRHHLETTRLAKGDNDQPTLQQAFAGDIAPKFLGLKDFGTERAVLFHVGMGRGKTTQIRRVLERGERSLILAHRQTLSGDIYANCKAKTQLKHYSIDFKTQDAKQLMGAANQLICQLESIHYLHGAKPYTNLMIDESQLLFIQVAAGTFKTREAVRAMWDTLTYHIRNAERVRCYDGFMGRLTADLLKGLGIENVGVVRMPDTFRVNNRTMYLTSVPKSVKQSQWLIQWATHIGQQVAKGKKVMVFYPFKNEKLSWPSMAQIMDQICKVGGIDRDSDTVMHFGDMDKKQKATILSDINTHWRKRVVMTNSAVTAGVDFTVMHFHKLYACASGFQNPREIVQWLSRARHIIDNEVHVVKISPGLTPQMVPDVLGDDPVFTNLIAAVNTELQNSSRSVIECYAIDAGYIIKKENGNYSEDVMRLAEAADLHRDLGLLYGNIPKITFHRSEFIQRRVAAQYASTAEMLELEMYFFKLRFKPDVPEDTIAAFWDNGYTQASLNMKSYVDQSCSLRNDLPDVCARIDDMLSRVPYCAPNEVVKELFSDNLDAPTIAAIERRFPTYDRSCTSDKKFINMVMAEASGMEIWRYDHKTHKWVVNAEKLQIAADLFAAVSRPEPTNVPTSDPAQPKPY